MQLYCDRATVWLLLPNHDHEIVAIDEDAEIVLSGESPDRTADVQTVLCFSVWIPVRPRDDLGETIDMAVIPFVTVPDFRAVWNTYPSGGGYCLSLLSVGHCGCVSL